jgi:hypothetical protein
MSDSTSQHGGYREGSGRKPLAPEARPVTVAIRVPREILSRLDACEGKNRSGKILGILREHLL